MNRFRFRDEVRQHVANLANLIMFANSAGHAYALQTYDRATNGVFGFAYEALEKIIELETSPAVCFAINHIRYGMNFGGNATYLDDVEVAITAAMEYIADEEERARDRFADEVLFGMGS